jgi:hypothetical protein
MPLAFPELDPTGDGGDPLRKLLPIEEPRVVASEDGFPVALTQDGKDAEFMKLEAASGQSVTRWAELPRHRWAVVGKAKPGATVLAYVEPTPLGPNATEAERKAAKEREKDQALIVRHNYGFGRVLYVGLDSTWRWRYKVGDTYHHRFWGQAIRWAAADKPLVTGNEYLRFGTPQPTYRQGEEVEVVVRLNDEAGPIKPDILAAARMIRKNGKDGKEEVVAMIPLGKREGQPRVLQGKVANLPPGDYAVELTVPDLAGKLDDPATPRDEQKPLRASFHLLPPDSSEMIDLQTNRLLLDEIAAKSGGQVYTPEDAAELLKKLLAQKIPHTEHFEQPVWQWWMVLVLVVVLLTGEWVGRKWAGLP